MHQCNQECGSQIVNSQLAEPTIENMPCVGFPSLEDPAENIYQAPPSMNTVQEMSLWPTEEGAVHPLPGRRAADFPGP